MDNNTLLPIVSVKTFNDLDEECVIEIIPNQESNFRTNTTFIDQRLADIKIELEEKNKKIENLEAHVDVLDCSIAISCGILTGLLDAFWVGEFSLLEANDYGTQKCNDFVMNFANREARNDHNLNLGKDFKFSSLSDAVEYLERKYKVNYDIAAKSLGDGIHHLYDYSHHCSLFGLIISIIAQFTGNTLGIKNGVIQWVSCGEQSNLEGSFVQKLFQAITNWGGHIVSDMIGSSSTVRKGNYGTGVPGPILSLFERCASMNPFIKNDPDKQKKIQEWFTDAYNGKLKGQNGVHFDLRTEIGVFNHLKKQTIVVAINEVFVRAFYCIRHFFLELKNEKIKSVRELKRLDWKKILPFKNRTIVRMLTISMGTMSAVDIVHAAILGLINSKGNGYAFLVNFALRINYVGVIRTTIALGKDAIMGFHLSDKRNERIELLNEYVALMNAKTFYKIGDMWKSAEKVDESINEATLMMEKCNDIVLNTLKQDRMSLETISVSIDDADKNNAGLKDDILDILKWEV